MAFAYSNGISGVAASYPGAVFEPFDLRDRDEDGYAVEGESGVVPGSADGEGRYRVFLDLVPLEQASIGITVGGSARTLVPYGEAVAAGQVGVSMITGVVEFHASDAGEAFAVDYTGAGSALVAAVLNRVQAEIVATQEELDDVVGALGAVAGDDVVPVVRGGTGSTTAGDARTALGLAIGTNVQAYSANLSAIAALGGSANQVVAVGSTPGAYEYAPLSTFGRSLIDDASASAARTTLGLGTMATQNAAGVAVSVLPDGDILRDLGAVSTRWNHVYASEVVAASGVTTEDLTVAGEVLSDLVLADSAKIWFGADVNLYRNVANQLATDDGIRSAGLISSALIWTYRGDAGADALTWLGAENSSTSGSFETNIFGRFRNTTPAAVSQFIAFRGLTRTPGAEIGEIVARPIVDGSLRDVAKFSKSISLLPKQGVLINPASTHTSAALEIDVDHATAPFLKFLGTFSADPYAGNDTSMNGTGAVVGPKGDGGGDPTYWIFGKMIKVQVGATDYWMPVYEVGEP